MKTLSGVSFVFFRMDSKFEGSFKRTQNIGFLEMYKKFLGWPKLVSKNLQ